METTNTRNLATFTHLSTLTQYFFPFGNFIFPLVLWSNARKTSEFADAHGKQAINFQLSIFLYTIIICLIAIPILVYSIFQNVPLTAIIENGTTAVRNLNFANLTGIVAIVLLTIFILGSLKIVEFFFVIFASVKAANGESYQYPMSIKFIK